MPAVSKKRGRRGGERQAPAAQGAGARRSPPRPRRVRSLGMPSRRWRSLLYRLAIGLGIAGIAVAYQDKLPHIEGRGAGVVSSQATDLAPITRITGHKRRGHGARQRRPGALDRLVRRRRHAAGCGTPAPARSCARSSSTTGRHRHRRRRSPRAHRSQGRRHRPVGPGARGEARHLPAPAVAHLGAGLHRRCRPLRRGKPGRRRHAVRHPHALGARVAVFEGQDGAQAIASARWSGLLASAGQDRSIRLWRTRHAQPRAQLARTRRCTERARHGAGRAHARQRQHGWLGALWSASSSRPQRSFKAHEGRVTSRRVRAQRPPARIRRRGRPGQAVGPAQRPAAARLPRPRRTRALRCLLPRRPPRHLRRPGRHHPRLEHIRRHGPGAGVTRRRTLPSISWLASRLKRRSRGSRPNDIASVSGRCRPGRLSHRRA